MTKAIILYCISILLMAAAALMAYLGKDGWGWFLFAGILCLPCDADHKSKECAHE